MSLLGAWAARPWKDAFPTGEFDLIMVDPPWTYAIWSAKGAEKGASAQYDLMTLADVKALPVASIAARDCLLVLWATNPLLDKAFEVLVAWGFKFKTAAHWVKRTKNGKLGFGTGYILRAAGEPILIGTRGSPKTTRSCRSVVEGLVREHSRKPEEAFRSAEELRAKSRRIELFSRERRPGWTTWGREVGKFDAG